MFCKIIKQTKEEKIKMYMKCKKIELIEMLIECNKHLSYYKDIYDIHHLKRK